MDINNTDFAHKKALIRVDFNVPIRENIITDDTRIKSALPTLKKILSDDGKIIIMSHWGRPQKELAKYPDRSPADYSLKRIVPHLSELLGQEIKFAPDCVGEKAYEMAANLQDGEILLLENLRFHKEEKTGDETFARKLSKFGDIYINDAFGTAHRTHASTATVAKFFAKENKMFGLLMAAEIDAANKVLYDGKTPLAAIIGGAKVSDKILIIENLLDRAKHIIIGGGMAYTFVKALGGKIGDSLCENDHLETAKQLLRKAGAKNVNIHLPEDSIIADAFSEEAQTDTAKTNEIPDGWMGLDIGPLAQKRLQFVLLKSKTILWNGPMGVFEMDKFQAGTQAIAEGVKDATDRGAYSLVGGGDSVAAVNKFGFSKDVSYVSTGGGALLAYFEGKTLPGIAAIKE